MAHTTRHYALFLGTPTLTGTVTAPTCGGSVTNSDILVTWTGVSSTLQSFQVQVFRDAAMTDLAYYSGILAGPTASHTIPAGSLSNGQTYYLLIDWTETTGASGQTATPCSFLTNYAPSVGVTGVAVRVVGGCSGAAAMDLPALVVSWAQVVPGAGETFVQYDVKRREAGDEDWTRIATITAIGTLTHTDYHVRSRATYEYAVVWQATKAGPVTLVSTEQDPPPTGMVEFDHAWVHEVGSAARSVRVDQLEANISIVQDIQMIQAWGRQAPIAQIGEQQFHQVEIPGLARAASDRAYWQALRDMLTRQRTADAIYCVRLGRAQELWFCSLLHLDRSMQQVSYRPSLRLSEIHYSEAV